MSEPVTLEQGEQATLLDVSTQQYDPYWVDPKQPLQVPNNPLHYAAHRYQMILARLDQQAVKNPAQFNSGNYIAIMEKLEKLWLKINGSDDDDLLDKGSVDSERTQRSKAPAMGEGASLSVGAGVSTDNPLAG